MSHSNNPQIAIELGRQGNGATYRLTSTSIARLREQFPGVQPTSHNLFIGYDTRELFEQQHGPMWRQIALLLTGLNVEQLEQLGGVCFVEPSTGSQYPLETRTTG